DAELGCGGTLALLASSGRRVGVLHLTGGEAGSRGTAATRRREAEAAAAALGLAEVAFLDCGDGGLRRGVAEEDALVAAPRRRRPPRSPLPSSDAPSSAARSTSACSSAPPTASPSGARCHSPSATRWRSFLEARVETRPADRARGADSLMRIGISCYPTYG